jgi:transcriptional/translational regulatory protein YebC/TACO1
MMQSQEIQQRFSRIEQAIGQAAQTCLSEVDTPPQLKDAIQKLDRQSSLTKEVIQSSDQSRIRKAVDDLEMLGDEAKRVCRNEAQVAPRLKEAVTRVHDELSELKHQLH